MSWFNLIKFKLIFYQSHSIATNNHNEIKIN